MRGAPRVAWVLLAILLVSAVARAVLYTANAPLWDASTYVLMGKHLFSGGEVGLWEDVRPVLWPALLGLAWRWGGDPLVVGQLLQILFGLGLIAAVFDVGRRAWDDATGLVAAVLLAMSPILFNWGNHLYTGIPATALATAAVAAGLRRRWAWAGALLGLAFLMRFVLVLAVVAAIPPLVAAVRARRFDPVRRAALGWAAAVAPYLVFNAIRYGHPLQPFLQGVGNFDAYTHVWESGRAYYLSFLLQHENTLLWLAPVGLGLALVRRHGARLAVQLPGWAFLVFFSLSQVQTVRYIIPALPFLSLGVAATLTWLWGRVRGPALRGALCVGLAALLLIPWARDVRKLRFEPRRTDVFQDFAAQFEAGGGTEVWVSSPTMIVFTDLRAAELMYYPVFDAARAADLERRLPRSGVVMISRYDLPCTPQNDPACLAGRAQLFETLRADFRTVWESEDREDRVEAGIYLRAGP